MLLSSLVLFSSSCATNTVAIDSCVWVKIITISKDDVLTDETAREILSHNQKVEEICQ